MAPLGRRVAGNPGLYRLAATARWISQSRQIESGLVRRLNIPLVTVLGNLDLDKVWIQAMTSITLGGLMTHF
ncbi:hypothetical protein C8R32_11358 [Nitrosospira sp. Nsp5]|jgi:hypothetical protein|uniref:Uncharacterized protein n=1 Tax=Nitrosospira multiformis TaxID=1231 RepID=A0ABY0THL3_9PROT|nr:hypothetical protein [Nitrosospira sp. Nsp13]PTR06102.1 hypothetical protein C8R32_11358 [Nitrosospira sp. Nsp5]SCY52155.1 hypothetical protein SAMN05216308_1155 [Nitrosospira sp. Nsp13]SDQ84998.1 hypothetical protein SAMN05216402_2540 [Nitrosospira multiformis]